MNSPKGPPSVQLEQVDPWSQKMTPKEGDTAAEKLLEPFWLHRESSEDRARQTRCCGGNTD